MDTTNEREKEWTRQGEALNRMMNEQTRALRSIRDAAWIIALFTLLAVANTLPQMTLNQLGWIVVIFLVLVGGLHAADAVVRAIARR